ncbi:hypothetical protein Btru_020151 [Bulinus truncatus]|nr:hypothetical protein Btru_020151 [Bulinus truncatus]
MPINWFNYQASSDECPSRQQVVATLGDIGDVTMTTNILYCSGYLGLTISFMAFLAVFLVTFLCEQNQWMYLV